MNKSGLQIVIQTLFNLYQQSIKVLLSTILPICHRILLIFPKKHQKIIKLTPHLEYKKIIHINFHVIMHLDQNTRIRRYI